jgi:hypothetical protein
VGSKSALDSVWLAADDVSARSGGTHQRLFQPETWPCKVGKTKLEQNLALQRQLRLLWHRLYECRGMYPLMTTPPAILLCLLSRSITKTPNRPHRPACFSWYGGSGTVLGAACCTSDNCVRRRGEPAVIELAWAEVALAVVIVVDGLLISLERTVL